MTSPKISVDRVLEMLSDFEEELYDHTMDEIQVMLQSTPYLVYPCAIVLDALFSEKFEDIKRAIHEEAEK